MTKLTDSQILSIVANELSNANITSSSPTMLRDPLSYYLGLPNGTEQEGRSAITSTDVADAIEWIMPQIMESFTQNNQVVVFDPLNKGDEKQADIESEYVYDVLMKQNDGFVLLHQFVKDALMQRNGMLKVYYEDEEEVNTHSYTGLTEEQLNMLVSREDTEILSLEPVQTMDEMGQTTNYYNVEISVTTKCGKVCIDSVSPEEFRVNSQHNNISLANARFTCHILSKSLSDLREEGLSEDDLESLATADLIRSSYRFNMQNEATLIPSTIGKEDDANKLIEIAECYLKLDMNQTGISKLMKVTVAGVEPPTKVLSIEPIDCSPWVATTCILMSHKFQGLSIYDRLKEVQDNKTALVRNIMDNIYLQNNQQLLIVEGRVNIDDFVVSRPGGLRRVKSLDSVAPLVTPTLGDSAFHMMQYLDEVKSGRTGVSPDGTATPENIGNAIGSQGANRMMTAKEQLVGLIIRVICETGIKPLCTKIRDLVTMHQDSIEDYQFKGQWIKVNPATWPKRSKATVRVGTGTGDVSGKLSAITQLQQIQAQIIAQPGQSLINQNKIYATLDDFCKFAGLTSANKYFVDPNSPEGQQSTQQAQQQQGQDKQKQEQAQLEQIRMQAELAKSATTTAEAQMANVQLKGQVELGKHQREMEKQTAASEIANLKAQLEQLQLLQKNKDAADQLQFKYDELEANIAMEVTKLNAITTSPQVDNFIANEEAIDQDLGDKSENDEAPEPQEPTEPVTPGVATEKLVNMIDSVVKTQGALFDAIQTVATTKPEPAKPVNVIRDADGNILRLE